MKHSDTTISNAKFEELLRDYGGLINRLCYYYASNSEDRNDLRQDIYVNLWRGLPNFRGESSMSSWIYRVCLNTCVSTIRRQSRNIGDSLEQHHDIADFSTESDHDNSAMLHHLISRLDTLDKAVIMMWLDELPYEEIADITGLKRNTIASRIRRIKEKLASMMQNE